MLQREPIAKAAVALHQRLQHLLAADQDQAELGMLARARCAAAGTVTDVP